MPFLSSDGANIFVEMAGAGPPILLLHDAASDHRRWDAYVGALRERATVARIDRRGCGRSAGDAAAPLAQRTRDVLRVLVQIGMDRLNPGHLVAAGDAAWEALGAARAQPRAVRGVLLLAPLEVEPDAEAWEPIGSVLWVASAAGDRSEVRSTTRALVAWVPEAQCLDLATGSLFDAENRAAVESLLLEFAGRAGLVL